MISPKKMNAPLQIKIDSCMAETRIRFEECPEEMLAKLVPLLVGRNLSNLLKENMKGRKKAE